MLPGGLFSFLEGTNNTKAPPKDDDDTTTAPTMRRKIAPMSPDKVLNLPRRIILGNVELSIKAYSVDRVQSVQGALWEGLPVIALAAAMSSGSGVNIETAQELFCSMDPEAELLVTAGRRDQALSLFRLNWRRLSLAYDTLLEAATVALAQLAVDEQENLIGREAVETALSSSSLLLTDLIELIQTILDVCGGYPGDDIRTRF